MQWRARQLSAGYSGKVILDNVNLDLEQGTFHVILGLNGAGSPHCCALWQVFKPGISGQVIAGERPLASISERTGSTAQHRAERATGCGRRIVG